MNKVITNEQIEKLERYLDERKEIIEMNISPADKIYYNGMITAIQLLGFDYTVNNDKHNLFR